MAIAAGAYVVQGESLFKNTTLSTAYTSASEASMLNATLVDRALIVSRVSPVRETVPVWVTAYTSDPSETDSTPYITASGSVVHDGVAAANFLPIGTKFTIPQEFGDKVFVVEDRMNARYNKQHIVDIWFMNKHNALTFGKRRLSIELL